MAARDADQPQTAVHELRTLGSDAFALPLGVKNEASASVKELTFMTRRASQPKHKS